MKKVWSSARNNYARRAPHERSILMNYIETIICLVISAVISVGCVTAARAALVQVFDTLEVESVTEMVDVLSTPSEIDDIIAGLRLCDYVHIPHDF